jgi:hypothetical protein
MTLHGVHFMRVSLLLAAGAIIVAANLPANAAEPLRAAGVENQTLTHEISAAKRKKKRQSGYQAYGRSQTQIACGFGGCFPAPPGCRVQPGRIPFTWEPSGYDEIVCPYRPR